MKKLLISTLLSASILSWTLFFILLTLMLFPGPIVNQISNALPGSYNISYSKLINHGSPLNPRLNFTNLEIVKDNVTLLEAKTLEIGVRLSLNIIFGRMELNSLVIEDAFILLKNSTEAPLSKLKVNFSYNFFLDISNFSLLNNDTSMVANGQLNGLLPGLANGYFNITHGEKISNFSVSSDGVSSNFLLSLKEFNWMQFSINPLHAPFRSMRFGVNLLGSMGAQDSMIKGSTSYQDTNFGSFLVKQNYGSFEFQSNDRVASLRLHQFLQPFIDDEYPILFDRITSSISIPKLFFNTQVLEQKRPYFSNLGLENLTASYDRGTLKYSAEVSTLDLVDIYFSKIINLKGGFSGVDDKIKFTISPSQSFITDGEHAQHPLEINAQGSFVDKELYLKGKINELIGDLSFILSLTGDQKKPLTLKLSGKNISKNFILTAIPGPLGKVRNFIDMSVETGRLNNIFLDYSSSSNLQAQNLILKLSMESAGLELATDTKLIFSKNIVEINNNNLYFFGSPGTVNQLPIKSMVGELNFQDQILRYASTHTFSASDFKMVLNNSDMPPINLNSGGLSKGHFNLLSREQYNFSSIYIKDFFLPLYQENSLSILGGQVFISNLNQVNGFLSGRLLEEDIDISLQGKNLLSSYELDFQADLKLQPQDFLPASSLGQLSGKGAFVFELGVHKNMPPTLNIFSNLEGIELDSQFSFLNKKKLRVLPTQITISNFIDPEIYLSNELIDLHLHSLNKPQGYIAIGQALPAQFTYLKKTTGLNIYLLINELNAAVISSWPSMQSDNSNQFIENVVVEIKNFEMLGNQYNQVTGIFSLDAGNLEGNIKSKNLNVILKQDSSGFVSAEFNNTHIQDASFLHLNTSSQNIPNLNARLIAKNSSLGALKIQSLDMYLLKNKHLTTLNNIHLHSNLMTVSPLSQDMNAYFAHNSRSETYKLRGTYLLKDSSKIPLIKDFANFSYFNGDINLQWTDLQRLQNIEGSLSFTLKDLLVENKTSTSVAFNLLGILNLKNILGKVANLDLTLNEFTATQLNRVQGDLMFSQSKARLSSPMFIETNTAKMRWIGQINKNNQGELNALDLSLDLRIRLGENIPWYAALLGGIPAVAGSAVISEVFEKNIDSLSNYQYKVSGLLANPKIQRIN